jgi:2'-5' RNA ligase
MPAEVTVAHITVAGPFFPTERLELNVLREIRQRCVQQAAFPFTLVRVASFSTGVVYLEPEPTQPFIDLQKWFTQRWPEVPLYGGLFAGKPHVSLAADRHTLEQMAEVVAEVQPELPIHAAAREVVLIVAEERRWYPLHSFSFGTGAAE